MSSEIAGTAGPVDTTALDKTSDLGSNPNKRKLLASEALNRYEESEVALKRAKQVWEKAQEENTKAREDLRKIQVKFNAEVEVDIVVISDDESESEANSDSDSDVEYDFGVTRHCFLGKCPTCKDEEPDDGICEDCTSGASGDKEYCGHCHCCCMR